MSKLKDAFLSGKRTLDNIYDRILIVHRRRREVKKYQDESRKKVYTKVQLTKEQCADIDRFFIENYGKKIPYTWHRYYTAFTGIFDVRYFPELLYIPEFEHFMNYYDQYNNVFSDKNIIPMIAQSVGVKTPAPIISVVKGAYRNSQNNVISRKEAQEILHDFGKAFIKPSVDTNSGQGCAIVDFADGIDKESQKSIDELFDLMGKDFVVQELLTCHSSISALYSKSVNTFRVMTYRWKDSIKTTPTTMRIGQGGAYLDNVHAGGMCIFIDNEGYLGDKAFTEFGDEYLEHPDTHILFNGYQILEFPKVLAAAKRLHEAIPQMGVIHWDFTINENGEPVLIEGNMVNTSVQLIQRPSGQSAFGEDTAEILQWVRLMKKTKKSKRAKYLYGKMN